ncbi:hypothetical protein ACFL6S_27280 [Candidatus Poribacteria bacterium]
MEIKVIAIAPNDGWAFIKTAEGISLLRPPYVSSNQIEVTQSDVEKALHLHGFEECDSSFDNVREVIGFLKDKYVESMKNLGIELPSSDELRESLKYASNDALLKFLERAEKELIPKGKYKVARSIAIDIMKLEKVKSNSEIHNKALSVFEKCDQAERGMDELIQEAGNQQETWKDKFPNATKKYSAEAINTRTKSVRENGEILRMVA